MDSIHLDEIAAICSKYSGYGYYMEDMIPDKILFNAFRALNIPANEHIIAFLDSTITGRGKKGLAIATSGVYWRNGWTTYSLHRYHKWDQFAQVDIYPTGDVDVMLGEGCIFNMAGCYYDRDRLVRMLQHVQHYVIKVLPFARSDYGDDAPAAIEEGEEDEADVENEEDAENEENVENEEGAENEENVENEEGAENEENEEDAESGWWVAIEGRQYGPYNLYVLQEFVNDEQLRPEDAYVWKPGMPEWVPFMEQPETAALVARRK